MPRMRAEAAIQVALVAGVLMLGAGCARPALHPAPDAGAAADAIFTKYAATLSAGDADGWATLWMEDGVQMPPDAPAVAGRTQIREKLRSLLAQFHFDMRIHTEEVHTALTKRLMSDWSSAPTRNEAPSRVPLWLGLRELRLSRTTGQYGLLRLTLSRSCDQRATAGSSLNGSPITAAAITTDREFDS
jgi:hypothetical protein